MLRCMLQLIFLMSKSKRHNYEPQFLGRIFLEVSPGKPQNTTICNRCMYTSLFFSVIDMYMKGINLNFIEKNLFPLLYHSNTFWAGRGINTAQLAINTAIIIMHSWSSPGIWPYKNMRNHSFQYVHAEWITCMHAWNSPGIWPYKNMWNRYVHAEWITCIHHMQIQPTYCGFTILIPLRYQFQLLQYGMCEVYLQPSICNAVMRACDYRHFSKWQIPCQLFFSAWHSPAYTSCMHAHYLWFPVSVLAYSTVVSMA